MGPSRRDTLALGLASVTGLATPANAKRSAAAKARSRPAPEGAGQSRADTDGPRRADKRNGRYVNPVLSGDRPDPNILRDGEDYWATFSSFDYYPGVVVWHSYDLVNWTPVGPALTKPLGSVWALDIARHGRDYTTVSRQIARLEELGLVSRHPDETDRRVRQARITPQGKCATDAVDRARETMALTLFEDWSREEFDSLTMLLEKLAQGLTAKPALFPSN